MAKQDDGLFLLEVLIDKIVFVKSPCFSDKDFRTCVNIECPSVEPLEICDDGPGCIAKSGGPFVKTFNNGKSCLFSMKESDINQAMSKFPIKISVYKSLPCGCLPTKIVMGQATIDMTKEFVQARKKFLEDPTNVSYQALKDSFRIIGQDGAETGEIVMFLRISCFGKLIITKFQGGGPANMSGRGSSAAIDRSCTPRKDFQTMQDPCACGAARVVSSTTRTGSIRGHPCTIDDRGGLGLCLPARDPYNSMPCGDPDEPCYCSGPKPARKQQLACRNTDQYCLHVPKGILPSLPFYQELTEHQKQQIKANSKTLEQLKIDGHIIILKDKHSKSQAASTISNYINISVDSMKLSSNKCDSNLSQSEIYSVTSLCTLRSKKRSVSFSNTVSCISKSHQSFSCPLRDDDSKHNLYFQNDFFGEKETTVYMTLFDNFCRHRTSGTQATASVNKCLQACHNCSTDTRFSAIPTNSNLCSTSTMSSLPNKNIAPRDSPNSRNSDVFFFGWNKPEPSKSGVGNSGSKTKLKRIAKITAPVKTERGSLQETASIQAQSNNSSTAVQTKRARGSSASTSTGKTVYIRDDKSEKPCPAVCEGTKGDMMATVSHIRIGPKELCPVHSKELCQGPKCIVASSGQEQAPVKVTTVPNPRHGVFELVIRRMTGAPLAKNELMLEWTPPPSRPPPCQYPYSMLCAPSGSCRRPKCKIIICRPSYKARSYKKGCKRSCGTMPCRPVPYKNCNKGSCYIKPCRPYQPHKPVRPFKPCQPCSSRRKPCTASPCYKVCPPAPCYRACLPSPCYKSCPPTPCYNPCPPALHYKLCSPTPSYKPCTPSPCYKPCAPSPCYKTCRRSPCCKPCPQSPSYKPSVPSPCIPSGTPCCKKPCSSPCRSTPCLPPCIVKRKRIKKARSQPKIKSHQKRKSPCRNRSKACPVVKCRSMPGPCVACCNILPCPLRKSCSFSPCKLPKCCKSISSCCCG
ncbi:uncharacterized protein ACR2FA_001301 [Aphomia sociella]